MAPTIVNMQRYQLWQENLIPPKYIFWFSDLFLCQKHHKVFSFGFIWLGAMGLSEQLCAFERIGRLAVCCYHSDACDDCELYWFSCGGLRNCKLPTTHKGRRSRQTFCRERSLHLISVYAIWHAFNLICWEAEDCRRKETVLSYMGEKIFSLC